MYIKKEALQTFRSQSFLYMCFYDYLYSLQLFIWISSSLNVQNAVMNAEARRAFVINGTFKSIPARRI